MMILTILLLTVCPFTCSGAVPVAAGTGDTGTDAILSHYTGAVTNLNPDSEGTPWLVGGFEPLPDDIFLSDTEVYTLLVGQNPGRLRERVDHSFSYHMRPVFSQAGGSCGSASRICYMFAYELNCYRNQPGERFDNRYPSHFTWLLTGQNSGKAEMAIANGVPNADDYGGDTFSTLYGGDIDWPTEDVDDYGWMQSYECWYRAMFNRLEYNSAVTLTTPENLLLLKSWLNDHHGDTTFQEGGVAGAGCAITGALYEQIPAGDYEAGRFLVEQWGPTIDHGTTWSGYDDEVGFDFNRDGMITNDIDITGDQIVDMADWERGALIMLNSWGASWKNAGTVYVPYRLLKINEMNAEFYYIRKDYTPQQVLKVNLEYSQRRRLKLSIGIAADTAATEPDVTLPCHHFNYAGLRDVALLGIWADGQEHTEPLELGYDLTDLSFGFDTRIPFRYFLQIESTTNASGQGQVISTAVMDYIVDPAGVEIVASAGFVNIQGNGATTLIPLDMPGSPGSNPYLLIPQSQQSVHYYDSAQPGGDSAPANVLDGDSGTIWHTSWTGGNPHPHEIQLDLGGVYEVGALKYLPRQVGSNGRIAEYELYVSRYDTDWGEPVATGTWSDSPAERVVIFPAKAGGYLRLLALSEVNAARWTSIAELNVLRAPQALQPTTPANVRIALIQHLPEGNQVVLKWDSIVGYHYFIYQGADPYTAFPDNWVCLNPAEPVTGDVFLTITPEEECWFRVTAVYD